MKKYLFILLVLSLFLTSCENEIGFTEQNSSRGSFQITPQEAAQIASCSAINYSTRSKNVEAENVLPISFSEVDSTAQEANQPLMYVVNYKQGGYALVPADKRVSTQILALIDNGQFNDKVKTAVAYLISDIGRLDKTRYGVSSSATNVTNVKNALNTMGV